MQAITNPVTALTARTHPSLETLRAPEFLCLWTRSRTSLRNILSSKTWTPSTAVPGGGATKVQFTPGQIIAREGEEAEHFYLILNGRIALEAYIPAQGQFSSRRSARGKRWVVLVVPAVPLAFQRWGRGEHRSRQWKTAQLRATSEAHPQFGYEIARRMTSVLLSGCKPPTHNSSISTVPPLN